ncbi:MAG: hypothetical protein MdMp014T_2296 [Treponematales bacterium]
MRRLRLATPLLYREDAALEPFGAGETAPGERLFCFALDGSWGMSLEADESRFPGVLLARGRAVKENAGGGGFELPAGDYLFVQVREALGKADTSRLASELQKEALWQGFLPGPRLYLRRLFEDSRPVTQLFRPCSER